MTRRTTFLEAHGVPELLAPAGGPEPFNAALAAGADAIYCGLGNDFNARRGARNFDEESFAAACRRAHLADARVYVTVNVAVSTEELPRVLGLVRSAWLLGADAFIIQDWGLLAEVRRRWPQIETHVSTQANVQDARGVAWCRDVWGADRVTLSRELSLAEISRIAEEGVELECFGHGALCFCYSGVCLMSSLSGGRSANRGLCAQPCRLPYDLVDEDGRVMEIPGVATQGLVEKNRGVGGTRLLCPKDYCTVDHLAEMRDAGVGSVKVEGRMKAPDYVFSVISAYRDAIDALAAGADDPAAEAARHRRLKRAFNRDFTDSYLWGRSDNDMMSYERSNNRGELVGEVVGSRALEDAVVRRGGGRGGRERLRRHTRADVDVRLDAPVGEGDLLELRPADDPTQFLTVHAPADAAAGETICCRAARPMPAGSLVRVIRSQRALDEAARVADRDVVRRRAVHVRVTARLGAPFAVELTCADGATTARAEGFVVEAARTRAVSEADLVEHVGRMGQSAFEPVSFSVELDPGCGMSFSAVHQVRAEACSRLEEALLAPYASREACKGDSHFCTPVPARAEVTVPPARPCVCALVVTPACAEAALAAGAERVYAPADALARGAWPACVIPWLDEVCREADHDRLDPWVRLGEPVAVGNVSELALAAERGALAEVRSCVPVHNEACLGALADAGAAGVWLSPELTLEEVCALARASRVPVGLAVFGRERVMTSEHCVLQALGRCRHDCARCPERARRLSLRDIDGRDLPVRTDINGRSRIWSAHPLDATPQTAELVAAGVERLLVDGELMDEGEVTFAVERAVRALAAARAGRRPAQRVAGATSGHLFAGIG
ncbi:U32 family peptidase [Olsenella sp. An290]|uniref:U32 family peptidase n=1 Tax=Olsenella sp. An290 TaxID=1965625 RepID=UPI000B39B5AB|nr:U32 family peptidase [Olsenella sp. An290]OUO35937.1 peptidase U32 [Olsenella sp. An290]